MADKVKSEAFEDQLTDHELHIKAAMLTGDVELWIKAEHSHNALVAMYEKLLGAADEGS